MTPPTGSPPRNFAAGHVSRFQAAPTVYAQRSFLQTFTRATTGARKYVLLTTNTQDVLTFDLQEKIRQGLFDLSVPAAKK